LGKHGIAGSRPAGRPRNGRAIRGGALCRLAVGSGRPGADLSRPSARDDADHRRRVGGMTLTSRGSRGETAGLAVRDVTVTYRNGHTALLDAGFEIPRGTSTALVGINGSGKST